MSIHDLYPSERGSGDALIRKTSGVAWWPHLIHEGRLVTLPSHSEEWRTLSYEVGDEMADKLCEWADRQPDPHKAVAAAITVALSLPDSLLIPGTKLYVPDVHERRCAAFATLTGEPDRWQA